MGKCILFMLIVINHLAAQPVVYKYPMDQSVADMLGVLPDVPSYVEVVERYLDDSLVYSRTDHVLHNYDSVRYCFRFSYNPPHIIKQLQKLTVVNDSMIVQTSMTFGDKRANTDSLVIYRKDGRIYNAVLFKDGELHETHIYKYNAYGEIVERHTTSRQSGPTDVYFVFSDGRRMKTDFRSEWYGSGISEHHYTDTLITVTTYDPQDRSIIIGKDYFWVDDNGYVIRHEPYFKGLYIVELKPGVNMTFFHKGDFETWVTARFVDPEYETLTKYWFDEDGIVTSTMTVVDPMTGQRVKMISRKERL